MIIKPRYFRNKLPIDAIKSDSLWIQVGKHLINKEHNIVVSSIGHEHWFYEIDLIQENKKTIKK